MNRWHELSDGSWMCTYWDVIRDEHEPDVWRAGFIYDKHLRPESFRNPQQAMSFVDHLKEND